MIGPHTKQARAPRDGLLRARVARANHKSATCSEALRAWPACAACAACARGARNAPRGRGAASASGARWVAPAAEHSQTSPKPLARSMRVLTLALSVRGRGPANQHRVPCAPRAITRTCSAAVGAAWALARAAKSR